MSLHSPFADSVTRIELMSMPSLENSPACDKLTGLAHFAISAGTKERVDRLTEQLRSDEYAVLGEPRFTGDGYYESVIADPEGNRVEITI